MSDEGEPVGAGRDIGELLAEVAKGDMTAFEALYDRLAGAVLGTARRVLRDPAQAEEVAQEVMVEVWRNAPRYDPDRGSALAWALTIAHRRAVDRARSAQAMADRERRAAVHGQTRPYDDVAEAVETSLERHQVRRALQALTPLQRQAVELAYYGGHTQAEVSRLLDVPLGTVKTRVRDGLIRLRDALGVT